MNKSNNNKNDNNSNEILSISIIFTFRISPHSYLYFPHILHSHLDPLILNHTPKTHILAYFTSFYVA